MSLFHYISLFVAILFFIFYNIWRYNKNEIIPNWPIIGMLPSILQNQSNLHEYVTLFLKHYGGTFHFKGPWFTNIANFTMTSDPMNVHHTLSKNFNNYGKGTDFHENFDIFGVGIFNLDSNEWKQERTLLHSILKMKKFETTTQQNIQKKLENCLLPFLDHASKGAQVFDLHDILERFTFDIICTSLFGFDPNCFPHNFNEHGEIAYIKAIAVLEDMILSRHYIPKCIWKLQKWLQIGQAKTNKLAQENLHQFLYDAMSYYEGDEDVDESHSYLLRELKKEGLGMGEKFEEYIRDTTLNLLMAGNGSISSGISWFLWLVSTHPIVEAKIIREIKDNCSIQDDNLVTNLSLEVLEKLVYLHGAISEALRLYPPVPFQHKCAINNDILPSGHHVGPNTKLIVSMYAMGRMEQIWGQDCLEFKPERWISDRGQIKHVPSYKFITFNAGPRTCIGKDITFVQIKMVAATVLLKFHIEVVEGHHVIPRTSIILRMKHGLKVKVSKRCI